MDTLHHTTFFQLRFRHPANAVRSEVRVPRLDAAQATEVFVAGLLPLGYQVGVRYLLPHTIIEEFPADGLSSVEQVVDVSGLLVVYLEDGPQALVDPLALVALCFGCKGAESRGLEKVNKRQRDDEILYLLAFSVPTPPASVRSVPNPLVVLSYSFALSACLNCEYGRGGNRN